MDPPSSSVTSTPRLCWDFVSDFHLLDSLLAYTRTGSTPARYFLIFNVALVLIELCKPLASELFALFFKQLHPYVMRIKPLLACFFIIVIFLSQIFLLFSTHFNAFINLRPLCFRVFAWWWRLVNFYTILIWTEVIPSLIITFFCIFFFFILLWWGHVLLGRRRFSHVLIRVSFF